MTDKIFNIIIKLVKQGGADAETIKGLKDIKDAMVAGTAVIGTMAAGYYALNKVQQATAGEFIKATTEVEKFAHETGMSAEDSSRLLVVLKNLEISADDVGTAFKNAEKKGFQPTIEALAAMQEKYDALAPGMERTRFLVQEFGKGGLTLQKFFETGDIAERLAAVNKSLLITESDYALVQSYKDQVNQIGDAWAGLKMSAGKVVLPIEFKVITAADQLVQIEKFFAGKALVSYAEFMLKYEHAIGITTESTKQLTKAEDENTVATNINKEAQRSAKENLADAAPVMKDYFDKIANNYDFLISGAKTYDDYTQKIADEEATLGNLIKNNWGQNAQAILDAKAALSGYIGEQTKSLEQAMPDALQKAWGENMTPEREATLLKMETSFGLISQEGANAAQHVYDLDTAIAGIPDKKQAEFRYLIGLEGINQAIADMAKLAATSYEAATWSYDALNGIQPVGNPYPEGSGAWEKWNKTHGVPGYAGGGSGVVPPGYPNDNYMIGLSSGERYTVTPAGNTNYNYTYSGDLNGAALEKKLDQLHRDLERLPDMFGTELDKRRK